MSAFRDVRALLKVGVNISAAPEVLELPVLDDCESICCGGKAFQDSLPFTNMLQSTSHGEYAFRALLAEAGANLLIVATL